MIYWLIVATTRQELQCYILVAHEPKNYPAITLRHAVTYRQTLIGATQINKIIIIILILFIPQETFIPDKNESKIVCMNEWMIRNPVACVIANDCRTWYLASCNYIIIIIISVAVCCTNATGDRTQYYYCGCCCCCTFQTIINWPLSLRLNGKLWWQGAICQIKLASKFVSHFACLVSCMARGT